MVPSKRFTVLLTLILLAAAANAFGTSIKTGRNNSDYGLSCCTSPSQTFTISGAPILETITDPTDPNANIALFTFSIQGDVTNYQFQLTGLDMSNPNNICGTGGCFSIGVFVCDPNSSSQIECTNTNGSTDVSQFGVSYTCVSATTCNFMIATAGTSDNLTIFVTEHTGATPPTPGAITAPEPASMLLLGSGMGIIGWVKRKAIRL